MEVSILTIANTFVNMALDYQIDLPLDSLAKLVTRCIIEYNHLYSEPLLSCSNASELSLSNIIRTIKQHYGSNHIAAAKAPVEHGCFELYFGDKAFWIAQKIWLEHVGVTVFA